MPFKPHSNFPFEQSAGFDDLEDVVVHEEDPLLPDEECEPADMENMKLETLENLLVQTVESYENRRTETNDIRKKRAVAGQEVREIGAVRLSQLQALFKKRYKVCTEGPW